MRGLVLLLATVSCAGQTTVIRNWGNTEMASLLSRWQSEFAKLHPAMRFENRLLGPASAMAGIYNGVAELAWMGHEIRTEESMGFEWVYQYKALRIEVATASLDKHDHGAQVAVFVHRGNPIARLTLTQLDGIFGTEHRRGGIKIRTWGQLGLSGESAQRPIHVYGYDAGSEAGVYFRETVLSGSNKWNCDLQAFADELREDGATVDAAPRILAALAADPYGIAFAKVRYATASVKPLALAVQDGQPYVAATAESVQKRDYPLTRSMTVYLNRAPNGPTPALVGEFLRYVLSREGQDAVARDGGYLPLPTKVAAEQLRKLD